MKEIEYFCKADVIYCTKVKPICCFPDRINDNENEAIMKALDKNWDFINEQIDKTFSGIKTESKRIK